MTYTADNVGPTTALCNPARSPAHVAEVKDLVAFILNAAPARIREAIRMRYWEGCAVEHAAIKLRISRFALTRRMDCFFTEMDSRFSDA